MLDLYSLLHPVSALQNTVILIAAVCAIAGIRHVILRMLKR
jgi:hypothetical protein